MKHNTRGAANRRGYSLIELITVLVLVMIIAAMAAPSMTDHMTRNRTRRALDLVANDIALARMAAVRAGDRAVMDFAADGRYTIELAGDPPRIVKRVDLGLQYAGVQVTPPTADGQLVFDSRGLLLGGGSGAIVVRSGASADSAIITVGGRVYRDY